MPMSSGFGKPLYNLQQVYFMLSNREAAVAESWQRTLSGLPTVFGRLAYLSALRNVNTGTYEHIGLAQRIGDPAADTLLRTSHQTVFQEWLCFDLTRQKQEIEEYFSGLEGEKQEVLATWLRLEPCRSWVPADSRDVERSLFYSDLEAILELMRVEYGVSSRDPDS